MSLAKRQAAAINQIIQEEVQGVIKGRRLKEEHNRRAALVEYGPGNMEDRVDDRYSSDTLVHEVETAIADKMFDAFDDEIYKMTQKAHHRFVRELFDATQKHGLGVTSRQEVSSLLSDMDNEEVQDAQYELFHDVQNAINDYGQKLARALIKAARPEGGEGE